MKEKRYQREDAVSYAGKWAYSRNPKYYNFDPVGGDCTSFVSQCIYEGSHIMNYEKNGWYYRNGNDKAPAWSGVEFLYKFLVTNKGVGPYGEEVRKEKIELGDIAQLSFDGNVFSHTLFVVSKSENGQKELGVATHTFDAYDKKIEEYIYKKIRFVHIEGVRIW